MTHSESSHTLTLNEAVGPELAAKVRAVKAFEKSIEAVISELQSALEDFPEDNSLGLDHARIALSCLEQVIARTRG